MNFESFFLPKVMCVKQVLVTLEPVVLLFCELLLNKCEFPDIKV